MAFSHGEQARFEQHLTMLAGGVETCKANNIEPCGYLLALFKAPPLAQRAVDYEALLPWRLATPTI